MIGLGNSFGAFSGKYLRCRGRNRYIGDLRYDWYGKGRLSRNQVVVSYSTFVLRLLFSESVVRNNSKKFGFTPIINHNDTGERLAFLIL